jgi:two-component system, chemotaxis family, response regulator Rcp1
MSRHRSGHILLIEDNPADARITFEAIRETGIAQEVTILHSGEEAEKFLHGEGRLAQVELPDLILLDLNLPGKDGREILTAIKQDSKLRRIPVIVLSTSTAEHDVLDAYDRYANCYIVKPLSYDRILAILERIGEFWFGVARLPSKHESRNINPVILLRDQGFKEQGGDNDSG